MQNQPKKHHFVPVCYLKSFVNSEKSFWRKELKYEKMALATPSQVCYEIDGNRFNMENNIFFNNVEDEYHIEKHAFNSQENNYGRIILKIMGHQTGSQVLDPGEYRLFVNTLITIKRRNPSWRASLEKTVSEGNGNDDLFKQLKQFLFKKSQQFGEEMVSDEKIRELLAARAQNKSLAHDMYLSGYVNPSILKIISDLTDEVYQLTHYILHAPAGFQFITSDNPGFLYYDNQVVNGTGFGGQYEFFFPLSPTKCLYINTADADESTTSEKTVYHQEVDTEKVRFINEATKSLASKIILARDQQVLKDM